MIWGPFLLALALGIIVSAGLYFAYLWPQVEPEEPDDVAPAPGAPAKADPESDPAATSETEAETEEPSPTRESSPA